MNILYHDSEGKLIDFYELLGLDYQAKEDAVKSAFRKLIKIHHPDLGGVSDLEFLEKIIRGYRILCDLTLKTDYDKLLQSHYTASSRKIVPNKRVLYSASLKEMLKKRLLPKGMKRKDILYHLGQDIEILVTEEELEDGAVAYIELPSRMHCPLCMGRNQDCHVCRGVGRIQTTSHLEVDIPPGTKNNTVIDVNLRKIKPDRFTSFRGGSIRIKISLLSSL